MTLELLLSVHDRKCLTCERSGNCELQKLCNDMGIEEEDRFAGAIPAGNKDFSTLYLERNNAKCILCRRCVAACQNQHVSVIGANNRGFDTEIGCAFESPLSDVACVACGQCIVSCPTGALTEKDNTQEVIDAINDPEKIVIVQTAPAVRAALGEEFGLPIGTNVEGKMVAALRRLGFDKVFDVDTAADFTILEEGTEFLSRLNGGGTLPLITSCSPGWVRYLEQHAPRHDPQHLLLQVPPADVRLPGQDLLRRAGGHGSPGHLRGVHHALHRQEVRGTAGGAAAAQRLHAGGRVPHHPGAGPHDHPGRPSLRAPARRGVRSHAGRLHRRGRHLRRLRRRHGGRPAHRGGAAHRRGHGPSGVSRGPRHGGGQGGQLRAARQDRPGSASASGLHNVKRVLDGIRDGSLQYDFVEFMACPGGCINGGGQPIQHANVRNFTDIKALRAAALYKQDEGMTYRRSHENPVVQKVYADFLGEPGGHKAHALLHCSYIKQKRYRV